VELLVVVRQGARSAEPLLAAASELTTGRVLVVHTAAEAGLAVRSMARDVVVADPDMWPLKPSTDGPAAVPQRVAWLAARSSSRTAALLDAGVDEVLDASMGVSELAARLRRVVRAAPLARPGAAALGDLRVDARIRDASWQGQPLPLTAREIEVLQVLVAAAGATVPREVVYQQVWRWAMPRGDRTVDVNVKRLRDKLATARVPVEISTQPGVGYRVVVDAPDAAVTGL
jgi:DNA-binding response OmpR family regulator